MTFVTCSYPLQRFDDVLFQCDDYKKRDIRTFCPTNIQDLQVFPTWQLVKLYCQNIH